MAILDSGCSKTVCGKNWLCVYLETLSVLDRKCVKRVDSINTFRFGDGRVVKSLGAIDIPVYIGGKKMTLSTDIVHCDIPLLISRESLHKSSAVLDFQKNTVTIFGTTIPIVVSSSGHFCLPLSRKMIPDCKETQNVLFNFQLPDQGDSLLKKVRKLHLQFAHPLPSKLISLLKDSGIDNEAVFDAVRTVFDTCETCKRYKKAPLRPVVGFPLASCFNDVVAVDLKSFGDSFYIFHMIDHLSRFSAACLIRNKQKGTIVKGFIHHWFKLFGSPKRILCDNGGEFINNEVSDLCEKLNIELKSTAAESAWSNGMVERHNGILASMMEKVVNDINCSVEIALSWSLAAKNALNNVFGFSPNMLVFGRNPNLPNILVNKPPANNPVSVSKYLCENLNAMQAAREAYVQQESSEKLKRALLRKTRSYSNEVFQTGDSVYYRRDNNVYWHGPAKIIGQDGKMFLLKSNGLYIRVHACRLQHVNNEDVEPSTNSKELSKSNDDEITALSESDDDDNLISCDPKSSSGSSFGDTAGDTESAVPSPESTISDSAPERTVSDSTLQPTSYDPTPVVDVMGNKDLPKLGSDISFKLASDDAWRFCTVLSRGGKASSSTSWHYLNVKEGDDEKCISFKESKWKLRSDSEQADDILFADDPDETDAFLLAKDEELTKWKEMRVYEEVPYNNQCTISCRWVLTKKTNRGKTVYKARLVARGYEEDTLQLKTDSPTCSKESLRLLFSILAANNWSLHSIDIKSAFLQGQPLEREVYLKPPKHAKTDGVWKLLRCPYGLADASRQWYLRVKEVIVKLGATQSKYDKALFYWLNDGAVGGVIAVHVDDFIFGGLPLFHENVISNIHTEFQVGSEENLSFKYIGIEVKQSSSSIQLSMPNYTSSLVEFNTSGTFAKNRSEKLSKDQALLLKKVSGQLNWLVTQCRPDIAYQNCVIGNSLQSPCVKDLAYANKVIRTIKGSSSCLLFRAGLNLAQCYIVSFCDASFGSLPNGGSQGAFITFLADLEGNYCPLAWQSRRIRRVVKSTLAAECLAAIEAAESSVLLCTILKELLNSNSVDVVIYCDNRNLVDSVYSTTNIEDKRLLIDVCVLRDMVECGEIKQFTWVPTDLQVANCLTKQGAPTNNLVRILNEKLFIDITCGKFFSQ